ncbi:MAG: hypothetical protein WCI21_04880, partial [Alphaproteobacteria bacterium]
MKSTLLSAPGLSATIGRYGPGDRHGRHRDATSRISCVLSGGYREDGPWGAMVLRAGDVLLKSNDVWHEDEFGEAGAAVLAVEIEDSEASIMSTIQPASWTRASSGASMRLAAEVLEAAVAGDAGRLDLACA